MSNSNALLAVDPQLDFCPEGALPVPDGDAVMPVITRLMNETFAGSPNIFISRDFHRADTRDHFRKWGTHCVEDTPGAMFHPHLALNSPIQATIVTKGTNPDADEYSAFDGIVENGNTLEVELRARGVVRLYVCGLATDYCVKETVLDALKKGFKVIVVRDACRAVNVHPDDEAKAILEMVRAGADVIYSQYLMTKE